MRILVTGYKGFIGQNMVKYLEAKNIEVVGYEWDGAPYSLHNIDAVIHLGAISDTTYSDTRQLLKQNYYFTVKLINDCEDYGIPLQIASSASVYGPTNTTFKENDIPAPKNHYAWSKLLVEEFVQSKYEHRVVPVQVFRYFNVYGPGEDHKGDQASPYHKFTQQAIKDKHIKIFEGSENFKRDFIHVDDVLQYHFRFLKVPEVGIFNIGTGKTQSFEEVAYSVEKEYNCRVSTIPMPEVLRSSYQTYTCANMTKTLETLKRYET